MISGESYLNGRAMVLTKLKFEIITKAVSNG